MLTWRLQEIKEVTDGFYFIVKGHRFHLPLVGSFNVQNALAAIAVGKALEINWQDMIKGYAKFFVYARTYGKNYFA